MNYDVIVLGGGPGGYLAAERAGHAGLSTLLIEKRALGGVCLNEGCIPSKALLYSAKLYDYARHGDAYGVTCGAVTYDHAKAVSRKDKVVKTLVGGIRAQMKANHVTVAEGEGVITGRTADGITLTANGETYTGKHLILATGSLPVLPPIPGVREGYEAGFVLTNREILSLGHVPGELVIVGGGVIGLEMASYFNSVGSHVTVVEMLNKIAGPTDRDISAILQKNYEKKGVTFCLSAKVTGIGTDGVTYEADGKAHTIPADKVLLSIGRRPVTEGYGLETLGVHTERGAIVTGRDMQTSIPGVYAVGDVNGKSMLAHTAYREAEVAVNNILGKRDVMRYDAIPSVIYTNPEVGSVGETEETAAAKGLAFETVTLPMQYSGRYVAENEGGDGILKVLMDKKTRRLLGCHMICPTASEIIVSAGIMVETQMRLSDLKELIFPHPTACEIIREGLFQLPDC